MSKRRPWRETRREAGIKGPRVTARDRAYATTPVMPAEMRRREEREIAKAPARHGRGSGSIEIGAPIYVLRFSASVNVENHILDDHKVPGLNA